jgi:hypothetical protein
MGIMLFLVRFVGQCNVSNNIIMTNSENTDRDLKEENNIAFLVPDWQIKLGKEELQNIANGNADLMDWMEAKKQFKI